MQLDAKQTAASRHGVVRNGVILGLCAAITTGLILIVAHLTRDHIAREQAEILNHRLLEVLPADQHHPRLLDDRILLEADSLLGTSVATPAYLSRSNGTPAGVVLQVAAPDGYSGTIHLLVGVDTAGALTGVRVIPPHFETPGLGDFIELRKSDWMLSFNGKSLANTPEQHWAVKNDGGEFDAFTGATITPRAVVKAVHKALQYVDQHRDRLLISPAPTPGGTDHAP